MSLKIHLTLVKKTITLSLTKGYLCMSTLKTRIISNSQGQIIIFWLISLSCLVLSPIGQASDRVGRLGVGTSNQIATNLPAISFKIMNDPTFAIGGLFGVSTSNSGGGHAAGLKLYKIIYDEPQLQFFASGMGAILKRKSKTDSGGSGFQLDFTLGSEFSFQGLESIGFSFEFGVSMNKIDEVVIETVGYHFVTAAIHFYL